MEEIHHRHEGPSCQSVKGERLQVPVCSSCSTRSSLPLPPPQPEHRTARPEGHRLQPLAGETQHERFLSVVMSVQHFSPQGNVPTTIRWTAIKFFLQTFTVPPRMNPTNSADFQTFSNASVSV